MISLPETFINDGPSRPASPFQRRVLGSLCRDILIGGAKGSAKTWLIVAKMGIFARMACISGVPSAKNKSLVCRVTRGELAGLLTEAHVQYVATGLATLTTTIPYTLKFTHPAFGGGTVIFSYLEKGKLAENTQGIEYIACAVDEIGNFPDATAADSLRGCLRVPNFPVKGKSSGFFMASANPGGLGHNWCKDRWVSPAPHGNVFRHYNSNGDLMGYRQYLPGTLDDNPFINTEEYEKEIWIMAGGRPWLYRALRYGDWNITPASTVFGDLWNDDIHIKIPFPISPS